MAELNQTFTNIVKEAEQHVSANTGKASANSTDNSVRVPVARPRYHHARFVGERLVKDLAASYLTYQSERLRPGSYKSVRFATELLVSHRKARGLPTQGPDGSSSCNTASSQRQGALERPSFWPADRDALGRNLRAVSNGCHQQRKLGTVHPDPTQ